ncbi:MAG TPA: InlB B-repeat-containing protein, partial [Candidatus Paceibacterota bacterium]
MAKPRPNFYVLFAASLVVAVLVSVSVVGVNELGNFFTEKNGEPIRRSQLAAVQSVDLISNIGTASNWTTFGGTWTLGSDGIYRLTRPVLREGDGNGNIAANDTLIPNEFTLTTNAMVVATSHEWNDFSVVFGFKDINNYYYVSFNEYDDENTNGIFKVSGGVNSELFNIGKAGSENAYFDFDDNAEEKLYEGPGSISAGVTYRVKIERKGTGLEVFLNEVSVANIQIPESLAGKVGYGTRNDSANFSNLRVTEMVNVPDPTYALTVTKSGSGTVSAQGISCGNDCSETYALNTSVTLTATPTADSQFSGWLGSCSGVGSCMVTMNSAKSISATFTTPSASNTYILTIVRNGSGTVSGNGISCGTDCSESYEENSSVTLTATPAAGYTFAGWSGACSGSALCTVSINGPNTVIAV